MRLLAALARLNQIGTAINYLGTGDLVKVGATLRLIVESATEVVPGSSAVIYTYDEASGEFDVSSRVSAEKPSNQPANDEPRSQGIGRRAVRELRRVISYEEPDLRIHPAKVAMGAKAMACFPLVVSGEVLGVLYVYLHENRRFSQLELLLLDNFVNLTAMTLSLARQLNFAQQEQARKERELRRLRRAGMLISSRSSLKGTLETILGMALEVTDARYGIFRLVDQSGKNLVTQAIAGEKLGRPAIENLPIDENSIMGLVASRRETLVIGDLREEPWKDIYYPFDRELEMRSELAVPLIGASGRLEGVLNLESPHLDAFSKQDRYLMQILATHAVIAIEEIRLLDVLQEISAMLFTESLQHVHQSLVRRACDLLNLPVGLIWLREKEHLVLRAATNPEWCGEKVELQGSLAGRAAMTGHPIIYPDNSENEHPPYNDLAIWPGTGPALAVPLMASEALSPVGVFCVYSSQAEARDFEQSEWYKKVLNILGHYAVLAVQNARHQEMLRSVQEQRTMAETFAAVGDLATNLLHSLNNKVGTIPVRVEGIQDKCEPAIQADPYLAKNLEEIERSATEAMETVRESLYHLHPIQVTPTRVSECVEMAVEARSFPPGYQLLCQNLQDLPAVLANRKSLALVFSNLLENALDAMEGNESGQIEIRGQAQPGWVQITVKDSGPGIASELHERIFEFNYSTRASDRPGKLGFGLWWVKTLMARFAGTVKVESDGRSGTAFILELPSVEK